MGKGQVHHLAATGSETTASSGDDESPAQYLPSATCVRPPNGGPAQTRNLGVCQRLVVIAYGPL